jgi:hypothetical protein
MERHHRSIMATASTRPSNARIWCLLDDLDDPLYFLACDLGFPMQPLSIDLRDLRHAFHELGKVLKLRPLMIRGLHRHIDLSRYDGSQHKFLLDEIGWRTSEWSQYIQDGQLYASSPEPKHYRLNRSGKFIQGGQIRKVRLNHTILPFNAVESHRQGEICSVLV